MRNFLQKWFPWLASAAIFGAIMSIGITMEAATQAGAVCWYPYPAFMLLSILVLVVNHILYQDEQG
jgi:hypothetical protein